MTFGSVRSHRVAELGYQLSNQRVIYRVGQVVAASRDGGARGSVSMTVVHHGSASKRDATAAHNVTQHTSEFGAIRVNLKTSQLAPSFRSSPAFSLVLVRVRSHIITGISSRARCTSSSMVSTASTPTRGSINGSSPDALTRRNSSLSAVTTAILPRTKEKDVVKAEVVDVNETENGGAASKFHQLSWQRLTICR